MSKKFKTFIIIIAVVIAVIGFGVGGYFLMSSLSSSTVLDFKIVDPTNNNREFNTTHKYLISGKENKFRIDVVSETSNGRGSYVFSSSNPDVAQVITEGEEYWVNYYNVGQAVITARSRAAEKVYDSFTLQVSEEIVADITIAGTQDGKTLKLYANGRTQSYSFNSVGLLSYTNDDGETEYVDCNNMNLRIVDNYDKAVIKNIKLNQDNGEIVVTSKIKNVDSKQNFYIQAYYTDDQDIEHIVKNFAFNIDVVGYRIADLQLLVSQDYYFRGTNYVLLARGSSAEDAVLADPQNEQILDAVNFTSAVSQLYFKIRAVYTDGTFKDVSNLDPLASDPSGNTTASGESYLFTDKDSSGFWRVLADSSILQSIQGGNEITLLHFDMTYTDYLEDNDGNQLSDPVTKTFDINYLNYSDKTASMYQDFVNTKLYTKQGGVYEYIYWDTRFARRDVIVDELGRIIGFQSDPPTCEGQAQA